MYDGAMRITLVCLLACSQQPHPIDDVPQTDVIKAGVKKDAFVVRDEYGIPHIYGETLEDVAWVQGWVQASDRLVQLDLARHLAEGRLAELAGELSESLIDRDIGMRLHHLEKTAGDAFAELKASSDAHDQLIVRALEAFAAGVNAYLSALKNSDQTLPAQLAFAYSPLNTPDWTPTDSLAVGRLLAFQQSYTADDDIARSQVDAAGATFEAVMDALHQARKGIAHDLTLLSPIDPTYTLPGGWGGLPSPGLPPASVDAGLLSLLTADRRILDGVGTDKMHQPSRGSNNWVVGPKLSSTGHTLVANDPHLVLDNPATFHLVHLLARDGSVEAMGAAIPGVPGVVLGMNRHVAWAATDSYVDTCDVYQESIVDCNGQKCAMFGGQPVPLVARPEEIKVGRFGEITHSVNVTFYEVPHHGPILPRMAQGHTLQPLGATELSVRYTGYEVTQEVRAVLGLDFAKSMKDAYTALEQDFRFGGFNWVVGDDQGHFGWSEVNRIPRRASGSQPWKVMPGDGTAEWGVDLPFEWIPHSFDPAQGFLATANNDPVGITAMNDPMGSAPMLSGAPVYIGADYDAGTRVGRITKRLAAQPKLAVEDLQSIQADTVSELAQLLTPTLLDAANALKEEIAAPGTHPELAGVVASAAVQAQLQGAIDALTAWSFDTPSATDGEMPTATQLTDSRAQVIYAHWYAYFFQRALSDELAALGVGLPGGSINRVLVAMCTAPDKLSTGTAMFDDMNTAQIEEKRTIAAQALVLALDKIVQRLGSDPTKWRWGAIHTLALEPLLPIDSLRVPLAQDPAGDFPRHGDNGTVDVGDHGFSTDDFSYAHGPNLRFVVDLDPAGPKAKNALPGGETFDPQSPHYRDFMELWRKNQTYDYPFAEADVAAAGKREVAAHNLGRTRFEPK
jgi:penicillin amidase